MTDSVINDDDDEEAKRYAFSLSFVTTRCRYSARAAGEYVDQAFAKSIHSARTFMSTGRSVPAIPGPRDTRTRVERELIC
ncbi:MAG TPA: hypothetical protein PKM50_01505 [Methanoregula sp.]|nr:hypothetical protein [Methanoregula sp.]